jgi:hypothetical protein
VRDEEDELAGWQHQSSQEGWH